MTSYMRPDEEKTRSQIERSKAQDTTIKSGIKTAVGIGTSIAGAGMASRVAPFLNELIPTELALKGIRKISPKLGNFLDRGIEKGLDLKEGLQYIRDNLGSSKKAPDQRSIIEQYSPSLFGVLKNLIQTGRSPLEAGALVQLDKIFKKDIEDMEKDHKVPFSSIIEATFGSAQQPQSVQGGQPQAQGQQQAGGQGQQALMAILQKIQQQRGIK